MPFDVLDMLRIGRSLAEGGVACEDAHRDRTLVQYGLKMARPSLIAEISIARSSQDEPQICNVYAHQVSSCDLVTIHPI